MGLYFRGLLVVPRKLVLAFGEVLDPRQVVAVLAARLADISPASQVEDVVLERPVLACLVDETREKLRLSILPI